MSLYSLNSQSLQGDMCSNDKFGFLYEKARFF